MRKKSHLSLTGYLIKNMDKDALCVHKKAFYLGSILPDCMPSFLVRRHCIDDTFSILRKEIKRLTEKFDEDKDINGYYCRHLGIITHYVADYFTLPHNSIFDGKMKEHCSYEKELKFELRNYVKSDEAAKERDSSIKKVNVDDICNFIKEKHDEYLLEIRKDVQEDITYIVELCHKVVDMILSIFEYKVRYAYVRSDY